MKPTSDHSDDTPGDTPNGPESVVSSTTPLTTKQIDKQVVTLALPAFGALVAEPLFVLIDSSIVGHLGTSELAGLSLASTLLVTVAGVFVFLAYATTASVSRLMGAGKPKQALSAGIDGMWLALALGLTVAILGWFAAPAIVDLFDVSSEVTTHAINYLRWSIPGLPGILLVLAATGVLRGLQDTKTPLYVAGIGAVVNAGLNYALVYGAGLGIAGSGLGTALTQIAMSITLSIIVVRGVRKQGASLRPQRSGIAGAARAGVPLFIRTVTLRAAILVTMTVAADLGDVGLGAHQVVNSLWGFTAFALDALAIAAQALVGRALGRGDVAETRLITRRLIRLSLSLGVIIGVAAAAVSPFIGLLFTEDPHVVSATTGALIIAAAAMPLASYVFVLDGILIGAGDGRYLAAAGVVTFACYLAPIGFDWLLAPKGSVGLIWLWATFAFGYMGLRAVANGLRVHGNQWMRIGA